MGGKGIKEGGRERDFIRDFWGMEEMDLGSKEKEWKEVCTLCVILMEDG
jgi:hypothetical protein